MEKEYCATEDYHRFDPCNSSIEVQTQKLTANLVNKIQRSYVTSKRNSNIGRDQF